MAFKYASACILLLLLSTDLVIHTCTASSSSSLHNDVHPNDSTTPLCESTPYPSRCFETSKLFGIGLPNIHIKPPPISLTPVILFFGQKTLQHAYSEASRLSGIILNLASSGIVEKLKGTVQDCQELHGVTLELLEMAIAASSSQSFKHHDVLSYLSAALTNKQTCLEGLESATGPFKPLFTASLNSIYELVGNALAVFASRKTKSADLQGRRLEVQRGAESSSSFPFWLSRKDQRLLQGVGGGYDPNSIMVVAKDGSGNFTTISDAIAAVPKKSPTRVVVYVREGVYEEHVEIPRSKPYVALLGDGIGRTVITGSRSVGDGWTTFRSATLAVVGAGFLMRDVTVQNTAGAPKHQAVALRVGSDLSAVYKCSIEGYQDTLYAHSLRQFYRETTISGTVDFIFGNAAAAFQSCQIIARKPMAGQTNTITAHGRTDPNQNTGFSMQGCTVSPEDLLVASLGSVKSYLGRPWRDYARTVFIQSYLGQHIDPTGWSPWFGTNSLDTLYYGEYSNSGPGSATSSRVTWPGYHLMSYDDATQFTVSNLILGDQWLGSTSVPYNAGL